MRNVLMLGLGLCLGLMWPVVVWGHFLDVGGDHPYYNAVEYLEERQVVKGYRNEAGNKIFKPDDTITRVAALKILLQGSETEIYDGEIDGDWPDVIWDSWYARYVRTAYHRSVMKGYEDGTFGPERAVTPAEYMKMLVRAFGAEVDHLTHPGEWWEAYWEWGTTNEVLLPSLTPHQPLTRGELAEMTFRMAQLKTTGFARGYTTVETGEVSYYHPSLAGNLTANGETYDPQAMTAAHRTLPFGTRVRVRYADQEIVVRINDRGPFHGARVLDLSEAAFSALAPLSQGIMQVEYEIIREEAATVPTVVAEVLGEVTETDVLPAGVVEVLAGESVLEDRTNRGDRPYMAEPILVYGVDHYEGIELQAGLPDVVYAGTVLPVRGNLQERGHELVTWFVQDEAGEQLAYTMEVSGTKFAGQLLFPQVGEYLVGVVAGEGGLSRMAKVTVIAPEGEQRFGPNGKQYAERLVTTLLPEREVVEWRWDARDTETIARIVLTQGGEQWQLLVDGGLDAVEVPWVLLAGLSEGEPLVVNLWLAEAREGKLWQQESNWKLVDELRYDLRPGLGEQRSDAVRVEWPQYAQHPSTQRLEVYQLDGEEIIREEVSVILPNGRVETRKLTPVSDGHWTLDLPVRSGGGHVVSILGREYIPLWRGVIYGRGADEWVLPVLPWPTVPLIDTIAGDHGVVAQWATDARAAMNVGAMTRDGRLDEVAQAYAEELAQRGVVSHTDWRGRGFAERMEALGLAGPIAENLALGSDLGLALRSLETSPSHRKNLIDPRWVATGVGVAQDNRGLVYVVQVMQGETVR